MASFAQINAQLNAIPVGRYALPAKDGDGAYFFEIAEVKGGHRIYQLHGTPGGKGVFKQSTMKFAWQVVAVAKIGADPTKAMQYFGHRTEQCGACHSELTHERSLACGMGPKCAPKYGVKW